MKLVLDKVTKCSGRAGILSGFERLPNVKFETPALITHTKGGSVPHLSKDVLSFVTSAPNLMQYSLTNTEHMAEAMSAAEQGIARFVAQQESVSLLTLKDPAEFCQPAFHEKDLVPIYGRSGRINLTAERFVELAEIYQPDIYVPLFDGDTDMNSSKKRNQRSVDRTEKFLLQCLEAHRTSDTLKRSSILAPIVGGYNMKLREQSLAFLDLHKDEFEGYLLAGLHLNGISACQIEREQVLSITTKICESLPVEKPRFIFGAFTPRITLELVSRGVDIFDTSYPYLKTQQHKALSFSFNTDDQNAEVIESELDLKDSRWSEDFKGLVNGCSCLTCTKHTRAYSHHLFNTREMLGPILLMIHNLHHYFEFFRAIRKHVANDTLPALIAHLNKQKEVTTKEENCSTNANETKLNEKNKHKKIKQ
ncbi:queuine tRNA-ribosyltransferase accessory subunit 2 [Wyeomyia smithii]|uniref:queuine tRNA-ribosyltransferase accessory subunit 2 n=1 Tax=Wyeomyia smithii TaxID=174621 RepID=UPI0024681430|nr:queuine tRNA-ribosyltransferase accessory subunit 2 [Wyeomyia smithii]